jgi:hypothetical protein
MKRIILLMIFMGTAVLAHAQIDTAKIIAEASSLDARVEVLETKKKRASRATKVSGVVLGAGVVLVSFEDPTVDLDITEAYALLCSVVGGYGVMIQGVRVLIIQNKLNKAIAREQQFLRANKLKKIRNGDYEFLSY